jgi:hypothetical protein
MEGYSSGQVSGYSASMHMGSVADISADAVLAFPHPAREVAITVPMSNAAMVFFFISVSSNLILSFSAGRFSLFKRL